MSCSIIVNMTVMMFYSNTHSFSYKDATLQSLLGPVQLLLLLGQLHAELGGGEHVGGAAPLGLLQVLTQHVLHLPQQVHLLLKLGHLLAQQDYNTHRNKMELEQKSKHCPRYSD